MSSASSTWTIVGQGLAGTCLAWSLLEKGQDFVVLDSGTGGSSRVAAGLINPITGKNFEPSWQIGFYLPQALEFYRKIEALIGRKIWHPHPVLRLAASDKEWGKIQAKLAHEHVAPWVARELPASGEWRGGVELLGGGRVDTRSFLDGSREYFESSGRFRLNDVDVSDETNTVWCEGARGLMLGKYGPHRCAKGEILTVRAEEWDVEEIRIGAGGWLVPLGGGLFKVGSTYEWNELNETPTEGGRLRVEAIAARLGGRNFEIVRHEAGIRPILRRSEPLIGRLPEGGWMFNALGSKGSLYAPGVAAHLADCLIGNLEPDPELNFRSFAAQNFTK